MCVGYVKHHHGGIGPFKKPKYDQEGGTDKALAPLATQFYNDSNNEFDQDALRKKRKKNGLSFLTRALDRKNGGNPFTLLSNLISDDKNRSTLG